MSGGAGTRLWPVSTEANPKQFHALTGDNSLFVETLRRLQNEDGRLDFLDPIVLCNDRHANLVEAELRAAQAAPSALVLEPEPRNTAAVAAIAAAIAADVAPDAPVLLLPADHLISDTPAFHAAIERAAKHADSRIVTFGISPTRPASGYGYIKRGEEFDPGVFAIDSFHEKPAADLAAKYLAHGGFSWNSGMFLFAPDLLLREFAATAPEILEGALTALRAARRDGVRIALDPAAFSKVTSQPFDTAVMERTRHSAVVPCDIGWADIGSWDEIWRLAEKDEHGNAIKGVGIVLDASNNLLHSAGPKICVTGVENLIVVATPDAVIVLPRDRAQDVKLLRARSES
jgi:mannose-1-phosphate guanylyltransferase/mannose-1-phosphate guanylyltransferase/mannose-6-phosphate isomerase